jgi:hypothetical protein
MSKTITGLAQNLMGAASSTLASFSPIKKVQQVANAINYNGLGNWASAMIGNVSSVFPVVKDAVQGLWTAAIATPDRDTTEDVATAWSKFPGNDAMTYKTEVLDKSRAAAESIQNPEDETTLDRLSALDERRMVGNKVYGEIEMNGVARKLSYAIEQLLILTPYSMVSGDGDVAFYNQQKEVSACELGFELNPAGTNGTGVALTAVAGSPSSITNVGVVALNKASTWIPGAGDVVWRFHAKPVADTGYIDEYMYLRLRVTLTGSAVLAGATGVDIQFASDGVVGERIEVLSSTEAVALTTSTITKIINVRFLRTGAEQDIDFALFAGIPAFGTFTTFMEIADMWAERVVKATVHTAPCTAFGYNEGGVRKYLAIDTRWIDLIGKIDRDNQDTMDVSRLWNQRVADNRVTSELVCTYEAFAASAKGLPPSVSVSTKYEAIKAGLSMCAISAHTEWLFSDGPFGGMTKLAIENALMAYVGDFHHMVDGFSISNDFAKHLYLMNGTVDD